MQLRQQAAFALTSLLLDSVVWPRRNAAQDELCCSCFPEASSRRSQSRLGRECFDPYELIHLLHKKAREYRSDCGALEKEGLWTLGTGSSLVAVAR